MITRSLDSNHDWNFGKGKQDYRDEENSLAQNIKTRLLSFYNDCFFDLDAGIDWFTWLGGKDLEGLKLAISNIILETYGVEGIKQLDLSLNINRQLSVTYQVQSLWGETLNSELTL